MPGHILLVRDQDDRVAAGVHLAKRGEDLLAGGAVEVSGRLVGEDEARPGDEGPRDRDPLALPAGELVRPVVRPVGEADPLPAPPRRAAFRSAAGMPR